MTVEQPLANGDLAASAATLSISVVIPAFNEETGIARVLDQLTDVLNGCCSVYEIIVVDDGSEDKTAEVARQFGVVVFRHPENMGYGASLKRGILAATHETILITDSDGTYDVSAIPSLVAAIEHHDMVVGARQGDRYEGSLAKSLARKVFRFLAEYAAGRTIPDINSGLRVMRKSVVVKFFDVASDRFSFTTTITLALMLNGYFVKYVPVKYLDRFGSSKVDHFRDTLRAGQGIVQAILYYNPLKLFLLPVSLLVLAASSLFLVAFATHSALILIAAVVAGVGATLMGGVGLLADVVRRARIPR